MQIAVKCLECSSIHPTAKVTYSIAIVKVQLLVRDLSQPRFDHVNCPSALFL